MKNRWQWTPVLHGTSWFVLRFFRRPPLFLLFHLCSSQQCFCIFCVVQQIYKHELPTISNVHCIPSLLGLANATIGLDVGGGNGNSHRLNVSSLPINPLISAISSAILCRSSFSNPCWGLAAKC